MTTHPPLHAERRSAPGTSGNPGRYGRHRADGEAQCAGGFLPTHCALAACSGICAAGGIGVRHVQFLDGRSGCFDYPLRGWSGQCNGTARDVTYYRRRTPAALRTALAIAPCRCDFRRVDIATRLEAITRDRNARNMGGQSGAHNRPDSRWHPIIHASSASVPRPTLRPPAPRRPLLQGDAHVHLHLALQLHGSGDSQRQGHRKTAPMWPGTRPQGSA